MRAVPRPAFSALLRRFLAAAVAATIAAGTAAAASTQDGSPQAGFDATVELVQLQVTVRDDRGFFVTGLKTGGFLLRVNGERRQIATVYEVDLRRNRDPGASRDVALPPGGWRQFLLFFDLSFTTPRGLLAARAAAETFLTEQVHPTDLVAVATYDVVGGLHLLCPFILDRGQVLDVVATMGLNRSKNIVDPAGFALSTVFSEIETMAGGRGGEDGPVSSVASAFPEEIRATMVGAARSDYRRYREEVTSYAAELEGLGELLRAMRGRKHVVMFSSGFNDSVLSGQSLEEFAADSESIRAGRLWEVNSEKRFGSSELRATLRDALASLRSSDAVIYAFDTSGLPGSDIRGATYESNRSGRNALNYLASGTDGTVTWNLNDLSGALAKLENDTSSFYVVAYPRQPDDPAVVELKVELRDAVGRNVSAPAHLAAPPRYDEMDKRQQQLQLAESISKGMEPLGFSFDVQAVPFAGLGDVSRLAVVVEIPSVHLESLAASRTDGRAEVEVLGYVMDEAGGVVDFFSRKVNLDLEAMRSSGPAARLPFRYYDILWARPGAYRVRVLVRESVTGSIGTRTVAAAVPDYSGDELMLSGPVFIDAEHPGLLMRGFNSAAPAERRANGALAYPFVVGARELTPRVWPALSPGEACRFFVVAHNLTRHPFSNAVQASVETAFVDAAGSAYPLEQVTLVGEAYDPEAGATAWLFEGRVPEQVSRGAYSLRVALTDRVAGTQIEQTAPLLVVGKDKR